MKRAKKATAKKTGEPELEKQHQQLFPAVGNLDAALPPQQPYPDYPSPMRIVQTVTTYSACEDPIPNPYRRS